MSISLYLKLFVGRFDRIQQPNYSTVNQISPIATATGQSAVVE